MEIRQLQTLITLINQDFNVSRTAEKLFLVQSAVSQQLKRLETELDCQLFVRKGKRLIGLTELGRMVEAEARAVLYGVGNIQRLAQDEHQLSEGILRIGCTHTQARYVLPPVIRLFNQSYPDVELQMHQGNPQQLVEWAVNDVVDFSICTEELGQSDKLDSIPCYRWNRSLITLPGHPLLELDEITLEDLCAFRIITYVMGFTGRKNFNETFRIAGLRPNTVLSAADTDIIKTYVLDGLGIGVIAGMAFSETVDSALRYRDLSHLFPWEITRIAYPKTKYIRRHQQTFIDIFLQTIGDDRSHRFEALGSS
jgi:LysR family cys regulon transcriptional activator